MTAHENTWTPVDGEVSKYTCTCGVSGSRPRRGGAIVELRTWRAPRARPTARQQDYRQDVGGRAPTLDEQERR